MTDDEIFEKSVKIKIWMNKFEDNEWVLICGNIWLRELMLLIG